MENHNKEETKFVDVGGMANFKDNLICLYKTTLDEVQEWGDSKTPHKHAFAFIEIIFGKGWNFVNWQIDYSLSCDQIKLW